ncbi:sulfate transporter family protein [Ancylobacter dichloromethanicus]|uniref:Cysteine biosynthesis protein n=1 Tax=Ancylobacter dichloromethanicus TaxID=518825 RepID=A0A9W6JD51_9HYPH|nr:sulfate transporter family protein [Ancylobacter dichloromethanicus]MBS7556697.1 sulfate transporter family protein [Ancylobacter dichloromethanicus]GLK73549.1 cysteine biosynthesis protein [Ancylobacter dichloromethanicus]
MLRDALTAFAQTFSPEYRRVLLRSVGLAIGLLIALGVGAHYALTYFVTLDLRWAQITVDILAAFGIFIGAIFLVPPVTSLIAGLFLDDVAAQVERTDFPEEREGQALPIGRSLVLTLKFFGVMLAVNLVALLLLLVPGVNLVVFYVANGYLLGREYFQLAAMRYRSEDEVALLRRHHGIAIFLAGLVIAAVVSVPILNLVTPVFATIFMVRLHKRLSRAG